MCNMCKPGGGMSIMFKMHVKQFIDTNGYHIYYITIIKDIQNMSPIYLLSNFRSQEHNIYKCMCMHMPSQNYKSTTM